MPNPEDETPPTSLGFEEVTLPASAQLPPPESEPMPEAEAKPAEDAPINIVQEGPAPTSDTARQNQELFDKIMAARNAPPAVPPVQPPIPHVLTQTEQEKEAGRRMNQHFEALKNQPRAVRQIKNPDGTMTPVHRPGDFVPNMKQGYVQAGSVPGKT